MKQTIFISLSILFLIAFFSANAAQLKRNLQTQGNVQMKEENGPIVFIEQVGNSTNSTTSVNITTNTTTNTGGTTSTETNITTNTTTTTTNKPSYQKVDGILYVPDTVSGNIMAFDMQKNTSAILMKGLVSPAFITVDYDQERFIVGTGNSTYPLQLFDYKSDSSYKYSVQYPAEISYQMSAPNDAYPAQKYFQDGAVFACNDTGIYLNRWFRNKTVSSSLIYNNSVAGVPEALIYVDDSDTLYWLSNFATIGSRICQSKVKYNLVSLNGTNYWYYSNITCTTVSSGNPRSLDYDSKTGLIYFTTDLGVYKHNPSSNETTRILTVSDILQPRGIRMFKGLLYIGDAYTDYIYQYDPSKTNNTSSLFKMFAVNNPGNFFIDSASWFGAGLIFAVFNVILLLF